MFCPECGKRYDTGRKTCTRDGHRLKPVTAPKDELMGEQEAPAPPKIEVEESSTAFLNTRKPKQKAEPPPPPPPPPPPKPKPAPSGEFPRPGDIIGNRKFTDIIVRGPYACVYRCEDTRLQRELVTVIEKKASQSPFSRDRIMRHVQVLSAAAHPRLGAVGEVGELPGGLLAISEEDYVGPTLEVLLNSSPEHALEPNEALFVAQQVSDALAGLHAAKVAHLALRPAFISISTTTHGVSLKLHGAIYGPALLYAGADGKPWGRHPLNQAEYMGHEFVFDSAEPGPAADVFAFGSLCYRIASGRFPYGGIATASKEEMQTLYKRQPRPLTWAIGEAVVGYDMCMEAISPEPRHRPTAQQLAKRFALLKTQGTRTQPG
jgi:serine/threonine protein kinase